MNKVRKRAGIAAVLASLVLSALTARLSFGEDKEKELEAKANAIASKFGKELKSLAAECREMPYESLQIARTLLHILPDNDNAKKTLGNHERQKHVLSLEKRIAFSKKYHKILQDASKEYALLARRCDTDKLKERREEYLALALRLYPDNQDARRMLNHVEIRKSVWIERKKAKEIEIWFNQFAGAKHISWQDAVEIQIDTPPIKIINVRDEALGMLEEAVEVYQVFESEFGRYLELQNLPGQIVINHFDKKSEYRENLPPESKSHADRRACARHDTLYITRESSPDDTRASVVLVRHELTHIFCNLRIKSAEGSRIDRANRWVVEGIATFMEAGYKKLALGVYEVGLINEFRVKATVNCASTGKFKPLKEFTKPGGFTSEIDEYPQVWGLFHYLWNTDSGKYRYGLLFLTDLVYTGKVTDSSFEEVIGVEPSALDEKFVEYCKNLPAR